MLFNFCITPLIYQIVHSKYAVLCVQLYSDYLIKFKEFSGVWLRVGCKHRLLVLI